MRFPLIKRSLRVYFSPAVTRHNDIIGRALAESYQLLEVKVSPEVAFLSDTDNGPNVPAARKNILVAIENSYPDFRKYAGGLTYLNTKDKRNLRLPNYALICKPGELIKDPDFSRRGSAEKREFCAFVASNMNVSRTKKRVSFFESLHKREHVASGGKLLNNTGCRVDDLDGFYRRFRFCMAFENQPFPGYHGKAGLCDESGMHPYLLGQPRRCG